MLGSHFPLWEKRISVYLIGLIFLCQPVLAQVLNKDQRRVDRINIVTTHDLVRCPGSISCDQYSRQENKEFRYVIRDKRTMGQIVRGVNQLQESEQGPLWVSMIITGYQDEERVFTICTSHHFNNGYLIDGKRYSSLPSLDSTIALAVLKKLESDEFECLSDHQNCAENERTNEKLRRDLKLLLTFIENNKFRASDKPGS